MSFVYYSKECHMKLSLTMVLVLGLGINSITIAQAENNVAQKYQEECGACHFAYDARFLPARSWEKIMATLDKHFNEIPQILLRALP